jgi:hypothetical protein
VLGRRLVVEFFTQGVSQLGLALCRISLLGALLSGLIVALRNRRHRNAAPLTSAQNLARRGLLEWGSVEQNFIFGILVLLGGSAWICDWWIPFHRCSQNPAASKDRRIEAINPLT